MLLLRDTTNNIDVLLTVTNPTVLVLHRRACHWWLLQDVAGHSGNEGSNLESEAGVDITTHTALCGSEPVTDDCWVCARIDVTANAKAGFG